MDVVDFHVDDIAEPNVVVRTAVRVFGRNEVHAPHVADQRAEHRGRYPRADLTAPLPTSLAGRRWHCRRPALRRAHPSVAHDGWRVDDHRERQPAHVDAFDAPLDRCGRRASPCTDHELRAPLAPTMCRDRSCRSCSSRSTCRPVTKPLDPLFPRPLPVSLRHRTPARGCCQPRPRGPQCSQRRSRPSHATCAQPRQRITRALSLASDVRTCC